MDEPFFRARYDADAANQKKQSWSEYAGWVKTFYEGKRFPPVAGWADREKELITKAHGHKHAIVHIGRALAAEWAKDNSVRKVSTSDLQSWGKRFSEAAKSHEALAAALVEVENEMKKRGAWA